MHGDERGTVPQGQARRGDHGNHEQGGGRGQQRRVSAPLEIDRRCERCGEVVQRHAEQGWRALLRNVEKQLKDARKDLDKNGRKLLEEIEQRLAQARGTTTSRTAKRTPAKRAPARKTATARSRQPVSRRRSRRPSDRRRRSRRPSDRRERPPPSESTTARGAAAKRRRRSARRQEAGAGQATAARARGRQAQLARSQASDRRAATGGPPSLRVASGCARGSAPPRCAARLRLLVRDRRSNRAGRRAPRPLSLAATIYGVGRRGLSAASATYHRWPWHLALEKADAAPASTTA